MKTTVRSNVIGTLTLLGIFLVAPFVGPHNRLPQTELNCHTGGVLAVLPDMKTCSTDPRFREGCACNPLVNPWSPIFWYVLLPVVMALCGYMILRGSLPTRLLLLNTAPAVGLAAQFTRALLKDFNAVLALLDLPIMLGTFCLSVTVAFLAITYVHRKIKRLGT